MNLRQRLDALHEAAAELFPDGSFFLAVAEGEQVETTAHVSPGAHAALMRSFVFHFQRDKDLVITTLIVPRSPTDGQKPEAQDAQGESVPQGGTPPHGS